MFKLGFSFDHHRPVTYCDHSQLAYCKIDAKSWQNELLNIPHMNRYLLLLQGSEVLKEPLPVIKANCMLDEILQKEAMSDHRPKSNDQLSHWRMHLAFNIGRLGVQWFRRQLWVVWLERFRLPLKPPSAFSPILFFYLFFFKEERMKNKTTNSLLRQTY